MNETGAPGSGKIVLVYPKMGMSGSLVQHLPLSVLYAAVDTLKAGFPVDIVDVRLTPHSWEEELRKKISPDTLGVGISVMTGAPIANALEISRWVKREFPRTKVIWGGPHAMFNGVEILEEPSVDFAVVGYGSRPLARLARSLRGDPGSAPLAGIPGLVYRNEGTVASVPPEAAFERVDYRDIPYSLVEKDLPRYGQLGSAERIFSLYSVMGCPYHCAFCSSPAQYRGMRSKYEYLPPQEVADHIQFVVEKYRASYIYFIDDDSFVNLGHVESIIDEINHRGLKVKLGFRGARINEIKMMSDAYITKLAGAGTDILHIGAESGSQRMLDLMRKNCTVEDIIEINRKMARHPEIKTAYNWLLGLPGETLDDLRLTRELTLKLIEENGRAVMFTPNTYRPLPGTELYEAAVAGGYRKPRKPEEWTHIEVEGDYRPPWLTKELNRMITMMQVASYFIDDKVAKVEIGKSFKYILIRLAAALYSPIAKFRYRHGITAFAVENGLFNFVAGLYRK